MINFQEQLPAEVPEMAPGVTVRSVADVRGAFEEARYDGFEAPEEFSLRKRAITKRKSRSKYATHERTSREDYNLWSASVGHLHRMKAARISMVDALMGNRVAVEHVEAYCAEKIKWFDGAKERAKESSRDDLVPFTEDEEEQLKEWGTVVEVLRQTILALARMKSTPESEIDKAEILKKIMLNEVPVLDLEREILCKIEDRMTEAVAQQAEIGAELKTRHGRKSYREKLGKEHGKLEREIKRLRKGAGDARTAFDEFIEARNEFVEENMSAITRMAKNYAGQGTEVDDLMQEGAKELAHCIVSYDPDRDGKITMTIIPRLYNRMTRYIDANISPTYVPPQLGILARKIERLEPKLIQTLHRVPLAEDYAAAANRKIVHVQRALRILTPAVIVNPIAELENDPEMLRFLIDALAEGAHSQMVAIELAQKIDETLSRLTPRQERVIKMRFGLGKYQEHTFDEVGDILGVTRERIRQIEARALRRMGQGARVRLLIPFFELEHLKHHKRPVEAHLDEAYQSVPLGHFEKTRIRAERESDAPSIRVDFDHELMCIRQRKNPLFRQIFEFDR